MDISLVSLCMSEVARRASTVASEFDNRMGSGQVMQYTVLGSAIGELSGAIADDYNGEEGFSMSSDIILDILAVIMIQFSYIELLLSPTEMDEAFDYTPVLEDKLTADIHAFILDAMNHEFIRDQYQCGGVILSRLGALMSLLSATRFRRLEEIIEEEGDFGVEHMSNLAQCFISIYAYSIIFLNSGVNSAQLLKQWNQN